MRAASDTPCRGVSKRLLLLAGSLLALYVVGVLLWAVIKPQLIKHGVPEAFRQLYGEVPPLPGADRPIPIRKGNINGVPIAVPSNYLYFDFEYNDKSIWEARKPGDKKPEERTFDDAVGALTPHVRWPDMQPRSPETEQRFWNHDKPGGDVWLMIGVSAYGPDAKGRDLGWAPVLRDKIKRLGDGWWENTNEQDSATGRYKRPTGVRYELRGTDPVTGLQWAQPVGPGTEHFELWNKTLYWQGALNGYVSDMIACYNGKMRNPNSDQKCRHRFKLPEWGASISVTYPRSLLPQWRELKAKTRALVLSFQAEPQSKSASEPTTNQQGE